MKKIFAVAAMASIAAVLVIYDRLSRPQIRPTVPAITQPVVAASPAATPADMNPENPESEPFDDGTEMVLGLRVRKDRNCTVELRDYVTPEGEMFSAYTCTPNSTRPPHPYASYTDATLESMSYSDAEAASMLGMRLIERDTGKSYEMLIRATALDNDFRHVAWLADQAFGTARIDGELHLDNLKRLYELAAVSEHFGDMSGRTGLFRDELAAAGVTEQDFATLDSRVMQLLQEMRAIQITVFGESAIGGRSDA